MAHPRPYYQSEYGAKYQVPEAPVPLPLEQKVAGVSSLSSKAVREPAFTQKRKVGSERGVNDRVVQGMKFNEDKLNLENQALRFKTGVRRPVEKWPTEYKLQYGWKAAPPVPVLQAQQVLDHRYDPACPNKTDDKDWNVESVDGDSCDPVDSDWDSSAEQEPMVTATHKPVTAAVKKRQHLQQHKQKARTQFTRKKPPRLPQNATTTQPNKRAVTTKTKSRSQVAPNKTTVKQTIEQDDDTSDSDTDSQTGQKIQPPQKTTDHHHKCIHKKSKKRNVKRKLVWPMVTEYQSQYKTKESPTVDDGDDKPPAGSPQKLVDSSDPRLLKHSPMKLFKLRPESAKFTSEYLANYQSPTKLKYKEGAWSGVSPPHLLPQAWTTTAAGHDGIDGDTKSSGDWFNQVLELRRMAATYRRRAEGTHFVQVHLADIEGEDDDEVASTLSNCSVCNRQQPPTAPPPRSHDFNVPPTKSHDPKSYDPIIPVTRPHTRPPPTRSHGIDAPPTGSPDPRDDTESHSSTPTSSCTHQDTEPPTGQGLPHDDEASADEESESDEPQGRLPTPELKQIPPARKIRHHLDRTTPCKGAILTSPPKDVRHGWNPEEVEEDEDPLTGPTIPAGVTRILPRYRRDMSSHAPIYPSSATHTVRQQHRQPYTTTYTKKNPGASDNRRTVTKRDIHKTQTQVSNKTTPTTTNTANRKFKATEHDELECSFCGSKLHQQMDKSSRLLGDNKPLATHTTGTTRPTINLPRQPRKPHLPQQQPLSGSLLSLSSCSVASEVLQRAQHRKATFWNQRGTTTT